MIDHTNAGFAYSSECPTDSARVIQVIETTIARRGEGTMKSPIRVITQYWTLDGRLLCEVDPTLDAVDEVKP